jgi:hypothetical protein
MTVSPVTREMVWTRANSCCERCGQGLTRQSEHSLHHRLLKSRGGRDHVTNLVLLCGTGTTLCHGLVHREVTLSEADGWILPSGTQPAVQSIVHWSGELRWLLPDGTYGEQVWAA